MVDTGNLKQAAKDIGVFVLIAFGAYFVGIIVHIILGYVEEKVLTNLDLNTSGTAYSNITTMIGNAATGVNALVAIVTVVTGLLTLNVVLTAFGVKLNFNMGGGRA